MVKYSDANSFEQLLAPDIREIVILNHRYYTGNIQDVMDNYKNTDVIFL